MSDPRIDALARILVNYSTRVAPGDVVAIGGELLAEPLIVAVYEHVLRAGGLPDVRITSGRLAERLYDLGNDDQIDWIAPSQLDTVASADVLISISAPENTRALSGVDPARQARRGVANRPVMTTVMERGASGDLRWVGTNLPTQALAFEANMSLDRYSDLYFRACLADVADPVAAWKVAADETRRLCEWMNGRETVHITGPGTDLTLSVAGRTFIPGDGENNMPDGEFFTGPVEDSANGTITFHLPAMHGGRDVSGVRFRFDNGKVVDASADTNEEYLVELLDSDPGARFLGELGIGTNFGITQGTRSILLDEKIGGTVHLAIGQSYPETGGTNTSSVHWDMICDLRRGGVITVDGEDFQRDGRFLV